MPSTEVLVMHEIPMDGNWQARFVPNTNELGWVAHAVETANQGPLEA